MELVFVFMNGGSAVWVIRDKTSTITSIERDGISFCVYEWWKRCLGNP